MLNPDVSFTLHLLVRLVLGYVRVAEITIGVMVVDALDVGVGRLLIGLVEITIGAVGVDTLDPGVGKLLIGMIEFPSAQPVVSPWVVKAAVVVPQSHTSLWRPCTDTDGRYVKQFSVLVWAVSVTRAKLILPRVLNGATSEEAGMVPSGLVVSAPALFCSADNELGGIAPLLLFNWNHVPAEGDPIEIKGRALQLKDSGIVIAMAV